MPAELADTYGAKPSDATSFKPLRVLFLKDDEAPNLQNAILDHIHAIESLSGHSIVTFNPRKVRRRIGLDFSQYDVIVIHFSICVLWENYLPEPVRQAVAAFSGLKVQFIQDEYRHVDDMVRRIAELGVHMIYTLATEETAKQLYSEDNLPGITLRTTLTAYAPEPTMASEPLQIADRRIDVGYRARRLPFHLGELAHEKWEIAEKFKSYAVETELVCDVTARETDRLYGDDWLRFVSSCKTMLGTESGASIADFDGACEAAVDAYLVEHPDADYAQIRDDVLGAFEGNVHYAMFSPRIFEAAAAGTVMVMYPGTYSGVVESWKHYIPLERDFSNFEQVKSLIEDDGFLQEMADRAFKDLIQSGKYAYRAFVRQLDAEIFGEFSIRFGSASRGSGKVGKLGSNVWRLKSSLMLRGAICLGNVVHVVAERAVQAGNFLAVVRGCAMVPVWRLTIDAYRKRTPPHRLRIWRFFVDATRMKLLVDAAMPGKFSLVLTEDGETGDVFIRIRGGSDAGKHILDYRSSKKPQGAVVFLADENWHRLPLGIRTSSYAFAELGPFWHAYPTDVERFAGLSS